MRVVVRVTDGSRGAEGAVELPADKPEAHESLVLDAYRMAVDILKDVREVHRSCFSCQFWVRSTVDPWQGRCHLNPPGKDGCPIVRYSDFCGGWRRRV